MNTLLPHEIEVGSFITLLNYANDEDSETTEREGTGSVYFVRAVDLPFIAVTEYMFISSETRIELEEAGISILDPKSMREFDICTVTKTKSYDTRFWNFGLLSNEYIQAMTNLPINQPVKSQETSNPQGRNIEIPTEQTTQIRNSRDTGS